MFDTRECIGLRLNCDCVIVVIMLLLRRLTKPNYRCACVRLEHLLGFRKNGSPDGLVIEAVDHLWNCVQCRTLIVMEIDRDQF